MIRVLVVDDSAFIRGILSGMLAGDPEIEVVDTARDGVEALEKIARLRPDVVTLDVEMPRMDGLAALRYIMRDHPRPVLMISSLTAAGAEATIEALQAGAADFIPKQAASGPLDVARMRTDLVARVKALAARTPAVSSADTDTSAPAGVPAMPDARAIVIGVSTGGPVALHDLVAALPASLPVPVLIAQHMPPLFTRSLASRLDARSPLRVVEAAPGMEVRSGTVYLAQGGRHLICRSASGRIVVDTPDEPTDAPYRPSVDHLFRSAADAYDGRVLGVVMTGMGRDGLEGARALRKAGGRIVAQDAASCVVYGMPRAIAEAGLADAVLPLARIAPALVEATRRS